MILTAGIYGLEQSGKTTLYNIFTGQGEASGGYEKSEDKISVIDVPDENVDWLINVYEPNKRTYAKINIIDFKDNKLNNLSGSDIICIVLRDFTNENVLHPLDTNNPQRGFNTIYSDFILDDLKKIENRIEKLTNRKGQKLSNEETVEYNLFLKLKDYLEEENLLKNYTMTEQEEKLIKGYKFLTLKPVVVIINSDETGEEKKDTKEFFDKKNIQFFYIKGEIELEIQALNTEEQKEFMTELGITESGRNKLIKAIYKQLNLINFYTMGKDEVRAWSIMNGSTALDAAGTIHSDLAKGFIRAEAAHISDVKKSGSFEDCKKDNLIRLENKNYLVKDGDCFVIRFNVS
jgi:ribosome-binding ATPase